MRERPILFSGEMVRAILAGKKTQTRRVVKPQPPEWAAHANTLNYLNGEHKVYQHTAVQWVESDRPHPGRALRRWPAENYQPCPFGLIGDRLWVKETWGFDASVRWDFRPYGPRDLSGMDLSAHVIYRAADPEAPVARWRPSIHMPRWASRLTVEVTGVRAERLQAISEDDARAEGVTVPPCACCVRADGRVVNCTECPGGWCCPCCLNTREGCYIEHFVDLWDSINVKRAPWESNPWVFVIEFRRV